MKILALLTGRGGSKLKDKNIIKINGKPCMYFPCKASKAVKQINDFFVSSDDAKILKLGKKYGFETIKRPKKLSKINSKHLDVLKHALQKIKEKRNYTPNIIIVLLANAPIINSKWIKDCINILKMDKNITSAVPVYEDLDHNPLRTKKINNGFLKNFVKSKNNISSNRQELPKNYFLCHNFWVIRSSAILQNNGEQPWSFMGKKTRPYIIKKTIDIHDHSDVVLANYLLKNSNKNYRR